MNDCEKMVPIVTDLQPFVVLQERKPRTPLKFWIVVAYWAPRDTWKVFPQQWTREEAAREFCDRLHHGWIHRTIFHLQDESKEVRS